MKYLIGAAVAAGVGAAVWFWGRKQEPVTVVKFEPVAPTPEPQPEPPPGWAEAGGTWGLSLPPATSRPRIESIMGPVPPKAVMGVAAPETKVRAEILLEEWATS